MVNLLAIVVCHNRVNCMMDWLRVWKYCERQDAKLLVANTGQLKEPSLPPATSFVNFSNDGLDIGVIQRVIQSPPEPYDLLFWAPDDFLPMRTDFLNLYRNPFKDKTVGCVGSFWGVNHVRSGGVCVRREIAERLVFAPDLLHGGTWDQQRNRCYAFEHGYLNFWQQIKNMGLRILLSDGTEPPASPDWRHMDRQGTIWDRSMGSWDMWRRFELVFPEVPCLPKT